MLGHCISPCAGSALFLAQHIVEQGVHLLIRELVQLGQQTFRIPFLARLWNAPLPAR